MSDTLPDESQRTAIEVFDTPLDLGIEALADDLILLHGGGIVNPNGPTLIMLVAVGTLQLGKDLPIVYASLNPFAQTITQVGVLKAREYTNPHELLCATVPHAPSGCPTALLLSPLLNLCADNALAIATATLVLWLSSRDDGNLTLESVRRFPGDPVARVRNEIDLALAVIKARRQGKPWVFPESQCLTTEEATELATLQLNRAHWEKEWHAFVASWHESIDAQEKTGLASVAMPWAVVSPIWKKVVDPSYDVLKQLLPDGAA